ncbi:glutathione peroxidase [Pseudomonas matsuisoli]|uniref:Glutathione peroxidase n=2 Tax=Pseudomonas matsuisoli TaxID=1515666 RepID=A0A917URC0_9PSED|nr:glutathione peroxidase [Pseudomonas matsuisoli]
MNKVEDSDGPGMSDPLFAIACERINGKAMTLGDFGGKVLLVVNTASECGFTPQYAGLESLWQRFAARGLVVLAFPCNQFGKQEPGANAAIEGFCERRFNVTFPLFSKIDVNGNAAHPLFVELKRRAPGWFGRVNWNFTKFLVDTRDGSVLRFSPMVKPEALADRIEAML